MCEGVTSVTVVVVTVLAERFLFSLRTQHSSLIIRSAAGSCHHTVEGSKHSIWDRSFREELN